MNGMKRLHSAAPILETDMAPHPLEDANKFENNQKNGIRRLLTRRVREQKAALIWQALFWDTVFWRFSRYNAYLHTTRSASQYCSC